MTRSAPYQASLLLHHLLNQSLSSLDFCILWQETVQDEAELREVDVLVREFLESADLSFLDRALALLPEPEEEKIPPLESRPSVLQQGWELTCHRVREVSRADFRCPKCGFEITVAQEHASNTEMRLPFDNLECPFCHDSPP